MSKRKLLVLLVAVAAGVNAGIALTPREARAETDWKLCIDWDENYHCYNCGSTRCKSSDIVCCDGAASVE